MANPVVQAQGAVDAVLDGEFDFWTADERIPQGSIKVMEMDIPHHGNISVAKIKAGNDKRERRRFGAVEIPEFVTLMIPEGCIEPIIEWHELIKEYLDAKVGGVVLGMRRRGGGLTVPANLRSLCKAAAFDAGQLVREYAFYEGAPVEVAPGKRKGSVTPEPLIYTVKFSIEDMKIKSGPRVQ